MIDTKPEKSFLILGVLNVTPDSFSDGGTFLSAGDAIERAKILLRDGADFVDVGAESTRPGASPVTPEQEWERLAPILEGLRDSGLVARLSVDSRWGPTAERAAALGVTMFNNVGGLFARDVLMRLGQIPDASYIAMHMHGEPQTMQLEPLGCDEALRVVPEYLRRAKETLEDCGFKPERVFLDPGIGFGKSDAANLGLLKFTSQLARRGNVAIGVSRKGFVGRLLGIPSPKDRDDPCKMLEISQAMMGARLIRTHEVSKLARMRDLMAVRIE